MTHVVAIVPAKDRVDLIAATVTALIELDMIGEVVVVDDCSIDGTGEMARKAGARVVTLERNLGKGGAVAAGVAASGAPESYLLIDADLGASATHANILLQPLLGDQADMTIGIFPKTGRSRGFGIVKRTAARLIEEATGRRFIEPLSGQRGVNGPLMRSLDLADGFGLEVALTIDAHIAGARIQEISAPFSHQPSGRGPRGIAHRARQCRDVAKASAGRLGWRSTLEAMVSGLLRNRAK